ncbi:hypothetical protein [Pseudopedobacter sp.]|uniref:hypothetical protein n=1 Tax=Pseudopedobacter sp. TaxID=1936787 RepID=UPI00333FFDF3
MSGENIFGCHHYKPNQSFEKEKSNGIIFTKAAEKKQKIKGGLCAFNGRSFNARRSSKGS